MDTPPAGRLRITPEALRKAESYARLVAEEFGAPYESIGFLLVGEQSAVAGYAWIGAHDQPSSGGTARPGFQSGTRSAGRSAAASSAAHSAAR